MDYSLTAEVRAWYDQIPGFKVGILYGIHCDLVRLFQNQIGRQFPFTQPIRTHGINVGARRNPRGFQNRFPGTGCSNHHSCAFYRFTGRLHRSHIQAKLLAALTGKFGAALLAGIQGGVSVMLNTGDLSYLEAALDVGIDALRS